MANALDLANTDIAPTGRLRPGLIRALGGHSPAGLWGNVDESGSRTAAQPDWGRFQESFSSVRRLALAWARRRSTPGCKDARAAGATDPPATVPQFVPHTSRRRGPRYHRQCLNCG